MLSESDIEAAHPDAFDFVWGNLPAAMRAEFNRHLSKCPHCQKVIDEYSEIGEIIKLLPPHVEPSAELEDRTVAAMVAALVDEPSTSDRRADAEDRTATRVYPIPQPQPPAESETKIQPRPQLQPPVDNEAQLRQSPAADQPAPAEPQVRPMVTRLPVWRRYRGRLATIVAAAAAIIVAAIVIPLSLSRGPAGVSVAIPLHATTTAKLDGYGAASGQATARQDASGSWKITLTVAHLKSFGDSQWYECWYIGSKSGHQQVASAGTFQVPNGGTWTFPMTSAVDPTEFKTMVITLQPPSQDGAFQQSNVILSNHTL